MPSKLMVLHEAACTMSAMVDLGTLYDTIFNYCRVALPDAAIALLLLDEEGALRMVRHQGYEGTVEPKLPGDSKDWPLARWVVKNNETAVIEEGIASIPLQGLLPEDITGDRFCVPLRAQGEIIGALSIQCQSGFFKRSKIGKEMLELYCLLAGAAIKNARLHTALQKRADELSLLCTYSQQFAGIVDLHDVLRSFCKFIFESMPIDIIGFLNLKRRIHDFLYWNRGYVSEEYLEGICLCAIQEHNKTGYEQISMKQVRMRHLVPEHTDTSMVLLPLSFMHTIPLNDGSSCEGVFFFGAQRAVNNAEEVIPVLQGLVNQTRIALANAGLYGELKENYLRTIKALAIAVDAKDTYTHGHSENVMKIAVAIATEMNMNEQLISKIRDACLLHDIGKIGISGEILNKPGALTPEEFDGRMKSHTTLGANIIRDVPFLKDLRSLILHHHEDHDGTGYPNGLKGESIPLGARIIRVADAFEAMTSRRPYRKSLEKGEAVKELIRNKQKQFDPAVVDAFIRVALKRKWITVNDCKD